METLSDSSDTWEQIGVKTDNSVDENAIRDNEFTYYTEPSFGVGSIANSVEKYEAKLTISDDYYSFLSVCIDDCDLSTIDKTEAQQSFTQSYKSISQLYLVIFSVGVGNYGQLAGESKIDYFWFDFTNNFDKTASNQLTIEVTVTPKYGEAQTYKKSVNLVLATSGISTLSLDTTNYIF
jgi:hypothetical protein